MCIRDSGNTALLFVIALNIDEAVMYIVGVCGIAMYLVKNEKYRNSLLIGMGLGLIFFGIETMTAGVKPLSHETWFTGAMTFNGIDRFPVKPCHRYAEIKYS